MLILIDVGKTPRTVNFKKHRLISVQKLKKLNHTQPLTSTEIAKYSQLRSQFDTQLQENNLVKAVRDALCFYCFFGGCCLISTALYQRIISVNNLYVSLRLQLPGSFGLSFLLSCFLFVVGFVCLFVCLFVCFVLL